MGKLYRLRPKSHDKAAEALQLMLELPLGLREETRAELTDALSSYHPEPWPFCMLSRAETRTILQRINEGDRSGATAKVWLAALSYAEYGTGVIAASRQEIASIAGTTVHDCSRALSRLAEIRALVRVGRGKYALHPASAWSGSLTSRERQLAVVE